MSVLQAAIGKLLLRAPNKSLLLAPLRTAPVIVGNFAGPFPDSIAGLSGWWDAGAPTSLIGASGAALSDFGSSVAAAADKSGTGAPLTVYHSNVGSVVVPRSVPRVAGLLGAVGASVIAPPNLPPNGTLLPALDPDNGLQFPSLQMGSGSAWTRYLVWTRPNWRQTVGTGQIALLTSGSTVVLAADSSASPSRLILFPGASQTVLTNALERRHTHSVILRNTPGAGLDVWLDGNQVAAGAPNPLPSSNVAPLLLLHSGAYLGGAQCWFHEAATWEHALSSADVTSLLACATRWPRGARRGVSIVPVGQSNAGNGLNDGAWHTLAQGIAWHLGAAAWNVIGNYGSSGTATCVGGHGIYGGSESSFNGDFVHDPNDGSNPSTWSFGLDGNGVESVLAADPPDTPDITAFLFPWNETDSLRPYSEKTVYEAAARRLIQLLRAGLNRTASQLPLLWWNSIPFSYGSNQGGCQMVREAIADMANDVTQTVVIAMPQTSDSNQRGSVWNATTGASSGGDNLHRDAPDNIAFGQRGAVVAARAILAASGGDTFAAVPAGLPVTGGPRIASAHLATPTTVIVTVTHDAGTDLIVPLMAAAGAGWAVMDGGSVANPGSVVGATACARTSPTTLQVTLSNAVLNTGPNCLLFYPYGFTQIGRGNAVTDNYALLPRVPGWDIGHDLGSSWTFNWPLAATFAPVRMT